MKQRSSRQKNIYPYLFTLWVGMLFFYTCSIPMAFAQKDLSSAVIFVYHRIGEDQYPDSNLTLEQFKSHISELRSGKYNILPVKEIIEKLQQGVSLPDRTIGISFEGGYTSTLKNAVPLLTAEKLPFTIFIAPDRIDRQSEYYMSWKELKKLNRNKLVDIGALSSSYSHLALQDDTTVRTQTNRTLSRIREELDIHPALFAYPFGEYSPDLQDHIQQQGYIAAFGQHSGVVHEKSNFYALPRFSMTESYGDLSRFQMTANALPLPVEDITPENPVLDDNDNPPIIGFTLDNDLTSSADGLSCFASEQGRLPLIKISEQRIELRPEMPFSSGRIRINCTMQGPAPAPGENQRWRWFGMMLTIPEAE